MWQETGKHPVWLRLESQFAELSVTCPRSWEEDVFSGCGWSGVAGQAGNRLRLGQAGRPVGEPWGALSLLGWVGDDLWARSSLGGAAGARVVGPWNGLGHRGRECCGACRAPL